MSNSDHLGPRLTGPILPSPLGNLLPGSLPLGNGLGVSGRISVQRTNPADNYQSTLDTIRQMAALVYESLNTPEIEAAANDIVLKIGKPYPTDIDIARGTFWWIKNHIQFVEDDLTLSWDLGFTDLGDGKELLLSPAFMLQMAQPRGDCDDFSTLLATLLIKLGYDPSSVAFCTVAGNDLEPMNFTHVYVKVITTDGTVIPLDASHGQFPGWETDTIHRSVDWVVGYFQQGWLGSILGF